MALVIARDQVPQQPAVALLQQALTWVHAAASLLDRDSRLDEQMTGRAREVLAVAAEWIEGCRDDDPILAWSLLYVADHFSLPGAVELFYREAVRPVRFDADGGCQQHGDIDQLVGVQASEALGRRVASGEDRALEALFDVVSTQECAAVRIAAALALRHAAPGHERALAERLGDSADALSWRAVVEDDMVVEDEMVVNQDMMPSHGRPGLPPTLDRPRLAGENHG